MPIDREGGIGLVRVQDRVDCGLSRPPAPRATAPERRREAGGQEQSVLIPKRNLRIFSKARDHLAAGLCLAGREAGQVRGRAIRGEREISLLNAAPLAPAPEQHPERKLMSRHARKYSATSFVKP
jgi:hypothetical protein